MEIGLKERLIGAVVLVVLAVIIIPWVLKGGSTPDTTVTKSLTLPPAAVTNGQPAYHMDLSNPAGAASASEPAVITQVPLAAVKQGSPTSKIMAAPIDEPAKQPNLEHAASVATKSGGWVVQAGSYSNESNAHRVQNKLTKQGYHAYISRFHKGSRTYYRVRVGPYTDRVSAEHVVTGVGKAFGGRAVVVPNS
ncbi:MAG TPA: SPOR domain-containing protein [Gammaproteobacteria bacterium]|nr:SPOR domain-containing protein [Gammaproteobacteria bacterium]